MNERDEFDAIHGHLLADAKRQPEYANNQVGGLYGYSEGAEHALDVIRLKGYVKPRTITTAKELDALTVQSVILEAAGYSWQKMDSGNWVSWLNPGENSAWMEAGRRGPFILIHEGGAA